MYGCKNLSVNYTQMTKHIHTAVLLLCAAGVTLHLLLLSNSLTCEKKIICLKCELTRMSRVDVDEVMI